ncbi:MAG TPA: beta-ketoacyl-[acyl-carrier-protein] synthase family protein [Candidatus Dormibacteraeota bacterium]|nr:beta-ketoacyl-[acyl-carrier-protein] synthase family protein [Candidatus Dormibacteraeota bacterium]
MTSPARTAIVGLGCVSALGLDVASFWAALRAGRSGIGPLRLWRYDNRHIRVAAQLPEFDAAAHFAPHLLPALDPFSQYALLAAREAVAGSGLERGEFASPRTAVIVGTGAGGSQTIAEAAYGFYAKHEQRTSPNIVPSLMPNAAASQVAIDLGAEGPTFSVCTACASGNHAVALGHMLLSAGAVDRVIAGGTEAVVHPASVRAWEALRVLSPDTCRPFSSGRNGIVLGDGAGIFVLEGAADARRRNARVFAEIAGYSMTADAGDLLRPDRARIGQTMAAAIEAAGLKPEDIGYINAHGTGTILNDITESEAIEDVFGDHARRLAVSSTKSMHGHALGAASALELVATALALADQTVPPTANWLGRDEKCRLDYVPNEARPLRFRAALSNAFAFGGLNAVLAVTAPE